MYHYVRSIKQSRFPGIKGLEPDAFQEQLAYLRRYYTVVTMETVLAALGGEEALPRNAAVLTFDDGYADHHDVVLPLLMDAGFQGSFFVPAAPVISRRVLDVNKLHFVLAVSPDVKRVVAEMERGIRDESDADLPTCDELRDQLHSPTRFDSADVAYVKRVLQRALPQDVRSRLVASLFSRFVTSDESAFAEELYLSREDLRRLVSAGMHVGGHGNEHYWLGSLSREEQVAEIGAAMTFVRSIDGSARNATFCYPYGDYNASTLEILTAAGCEAAFTTRVAVAAVPGTPALEIPRLDTNDLPKDHSSPPNDWTCRTVSSA